MGRRESVMIDDTALERIPIGSAELPERYQAAKQALAECTRIDECKDWGDKALALASYARQAQDNTLEKYALRIRARAIRRAGELLRTFHSPGGRPPKTSIGSDTSFPSSQREAADNAGMSKRQEVTAVRVANVPGDEFDAAVDSDNPPTVTKLADAGKNSFLSQPKPEGFPQATEALGHLRSFANFCDGHDAEVTARGILPYEIAEARAWVSTVDHWLDRFVVNMKEVDDVLAR